MTAALLDGAALAQEIRNECAESVKFLAGKGVTPGLAVVLVGESPASAVYVRHKITDCEQVGIRSVLHRLPTDTTEADLLDLVRQLNQDSGIHGVLMQLPLPDQISERRVIETIAPEKDVDGFHVSNAGALMTGQPGFAPCTPFGVMKMLEKAGVSPAGKHAVIVGRSNIVGKPQAMLLLQADATVTICHSKTADLAMQTRQADILIAAVGKVDMITADMVKPGATVIDVGMNRNAAGKLCGDVAFESVREVAGCLTPVPGGVGPMTRAMLLVNTLTAARNSLAI
ncbi:MAG: bifunctional methylenetetrahydrofolate dehydrogenase/methenyltetrahydrofolate cyclohydrolase FolD [Burkholderiaceae bacterium]